MDWVNQRDCRPHTAPSVADQTKTDPATKPFFQP